MIQTPDASRTPKCPVLKCFRDSNVCYLDPPLYVKINHILFVYQDHFSARLVTGNTGEVYARTGYLGFLRRTEAIGSDGGMISCLVL